ncbi:MULTISPECIES: hypothetical protein [unclassified Paenibacillus]|uniref:hypothetical protein n=1 Tax=unclassified Paenibacillus TaxID=185978 RepID=UPI00020D6BD3|nr:MULTISPECIES: hypothetical protein [unclassified Paenibacillus]EGL17080.1 hypothetical protein HMPREF9413_2613 [Paenibacillus sp. HGF7]EPD80548.1 hypothetical protein HMPREF1207_05598 [Paenibacillus sp. HGH0039]
MKRQRMTHTFELKDEKIHEFLSQMSGTEKAQFLRDAVQHLYLMKNHGISISVPTSDREIPEILWKSVNTYIK